VTLPTEPPAGPPGDAGAAAEPRWGLGDVALGIVASMALSLFLGALIYAAAGWEPEDTVPIWGLALLQVPLWAGYLGITLWATWTKGRGPVLDLGCTTRWYDAPVGLAVGIATQVLVLPALYAPIFWLTGSDTEELSAPAKELAERAGSTASWLLFALLVGVCAPVVEELFYRGLLLRSLTKRGMPVVAAVVVSAAVFAAIHFQVLQFAGLFAFGLIAGALAARSGRLGPSIWAHIGFNMTTVVVLYLGS
jgi:membrane protease YdiL (CAAX protease family)